MRRAALHAAGILFAIPLRWFTPHDALLLAAAACIFNLIFLPALAPSLYRENEKNATSGIFLYAVAVLLLVALTPLHIAATCWAILACGDAAASVVGGALGGASGGVAETASASARSDGAEGRRGALPWNPRKTVAGSLAFAIAAFAGGAALWWWTSYAVPPWSMLALAAAVAALVEGLPLPIDDNLTVTLAAACVFRTFQPALALSPIGAACSVGLAGVALALGLLTPSGAIAGAVIATLLYTFQGWQAFALLAAFFVIGSASTRLAYRRKQAMGLAERRKGARVAEQAVANAGAAVVFAFMAHPLAMAAALAAATADTIATEIGPLVPGKVFLLATGDTVKRGTSGGISVAGTLAGLAAGAIVAGIALALGTIRGTEFAAVTLAAATGSALDSYLGGTLEKNGWLNNEGVNFLGTAAAGALAVGLFR